MSLLLPRSMKPSGRWKKRAAKIRDSISWKKHIPTQPFESPGRKFGKPEGGHVTDLAYLRKAIILCWKCQPKFDHKRYCYYKDERFPHVVGRCDGCRQILNHSTKLYIHESYLSDPGGRARSGHSWTPM